MSAWSPTGSPSPNRPKTMPIEYDPDPNLAAQLDHMDRTDGATTCNVYVSITPGLFYVGCNKGYFMEGIPEDLMCPACDKPLVEQEPQTYE